MTDRRTTDPRPAPGRILLCGLIAAAAAAAAAGAGGAAPSASSYVVQGKVTAQDVSKAQTFALRAATTSKSARTLRGKIVIVHIGVLTKVQTVKGRPGKIRNLRIGDKVSVTWRATSGTKAGTAAVDAPRLVIDKT